MSTTAQYAATPKVGMGTLSVANANLDGTGTLVTVFTAGASGSRIDLVTVKSTGTTTNGVIRLFIHNGTTAYLLTEIESLAVTPASNVKAWEQGVQLNLVIPTGYSLRASASKAETFNVIAMGGDF